MAQKKGPISKEDKQRLNRLFDQMSKTIDNTFKSTDGVLDRANKTLEAAERRLRTSEEALTNKIEQTTFRLNDRLKRTKERLESYDFEYEHKKKSDVRFYTAIGVLLCVTGLILISLIAIINMSKFQDQAVVSPPAIEETIDNQTERKL